MCGQESDGDKQRCRGREGEEVRSASGWITSGTTCWIKNGKGMERTQCRINWKHLIRNIDPT